MGQKLTQDQLDIIVDAFCDCDIHDGGVIYAYIDEGDLYVDAIAKLYGSENRNYITIDGASYLEGIYHEVEGVRDLEVDAWLNDQKVDVDLDYIRKEIINNYQP